MLKSIKKILQKILLYLKCKFTYFKNLYFKRKLSVNNILYVEKIITQGNYTELLFDVNGCHKIKIENYGTFHGNVNSIRCIINEKNTPIDIAFFGIQNAKETRQILIKTNSSALTNKFRESVILPNLQSVPILRNNLKGKSLNIVDLSNAKRVNIKPIKILPFNIKTKIEPFFKFNYPIKF